jgi:hypothetical protein
VGRYYENSSFGGMNWITVGGVTEWVGPYALPEADDRAECGVPLRPSNRNLRPVKQGSKVKLRCRIPEPPMAAWGSAATEVAEPTQPLTSAAPENRTRIYRFFVSHSCSFDHRRRPETFRTAIATGRLNAELAAFGGINAEQANALAWISMVSPSMTLATPMIWRGSAAVALGTSRHNAKSKNR